MTEQYIRYAAMFIIIMMAVIDDYRRFKVSNRIIIAGMVIGVVINMGSLMYGGDVRGYIYGGMAGFAIMYMVYIFGGVGAGDVKLLAVCGLLIGVTYIVRLICAAMVCGVLTGVLENVGENAIDRDNTDFDENAQIYSMIQESLIFDLYYRENCKSRPVWATDIGSFKHMTHAYCKNGKLSHVEPFHYIFPDKHTRKLDELPKYHKEPVWALFHYDMRDPLDHQALVEYVDNSKKPGRFTD